MKNKAIKYISILLVSCMIFMLSACGQQTAEFDPNSDYDSIVEQAKGQTVTFYGWGGNEANNRWIDTVLAPAVEEKYGITLKRVPMDIEQVMAKLVGEKQAGKESGSIDMIWINGENFYSAKENDLLFGPVTGYLPNFSKYVDAEADNIRFDYGYPTDGYESPYGNNQMVLITDSAKISETPKNAAEFLDFAKAHPGRVTYPALPDFTGRTFVVNLIYNLVGYEQFQTMEAQKETVREAVEPALDYLRELNPYLWNQGKTFPATSAQVDTMFADGELDLTMSCYPYTYLAEVEKGTFPATVHSFIFENGMAADTDFIAVAANSPHKAGALVVMNEVLSPEMQAARLDIAKICPAIDNTRMEPEEQKLFENAMPSGGGTIPLEELNEKKLPQMPAKLVPIIEEIWLEEVVGK